jgi:hypothetical protein
MKSTAVQKQAKAADKLHGEIYGGEKAPAKAGDPAQEPVEAKQAEAEATPKAEVAPVTQLDDTNVVDIATAPADDGYEQKYKTLQGMYNADIPRLQASIKELGDKNSSLESMMAGMGADKPRTPAGAPPASLLSSEEMEDYGEDMISVVKRAAREEMAKELEDIRAENANLKRTVGDVSAATAGNDRDRLFTDLGTAVPAWQTINVDDEFKAWLAEPDAFSGQIRHTMLNEAFERNNAPRVIAFFRAFASDRNIVAPQNDQAAATSPTVNLDTLVAPGPASSPSSAPAHANADQKIYTSQEVQAFYRSVQRGEYKGRDADKTRVENSIIKAGREGRVRQ